MRGLSDEHSVDDRQKISALALDVRRQLTAYGFGSLPVAEVQIPDETLMPGTRGL